MSDTPRTDSVICPACVHQFVAIPVDVQDRISQLEAELAHETQRAELFDHACQRQIARAEKAEAELATARRDALEQAAKVCDGLSAQLNATPGPRFTADIAKDCAAAIRAMVPK